MRYRLGGRGMIFDAHTHVYPSDREGFWRRGSSVEDLLSTMDAAGVHKAAVLAIEPQLPTDGVCDVVGRWPERLVAIGSVDPRKDAGPAQVDRLVHELGVRGIKLHPRLQRITYDDLDRLVPIAKRCGDLGIPVTVCSFMGGRDLFRSRTLELCHDLAGACPDTTLIMAHAGGHRPLDALMVLKANPNVHVDLSFTPLYFADSSVQQDLEYFVRKADPQRVLFGSDFPETSLQGSVDWLIELSDRLKLAPAHRSAIFYRNAARIFKA